ncbi:hypothetical protein BFW01_g7290 [Lasiodiplodia theobromae]|nr:hypothetical protein BFW01_g7290 [Lasiodiplodia theobromae]
MAPFDRDKTLDQPSSRKLHNSTDSEQIKVVMQAQTINETSFLTLPGELRNCIYEEVIEGLGVNPNTGTLVLPCRGYGCKGLNFVWMKEIVSSCRLGQVSRTVRKEFLSMLWRRFNFYYYASKHRKCLEVPGKIGDLQPVAPMLRGHVKRLFFVIDSEEVVSRFSILANILFALEFKGRLVIYGDKSYVIAFEEALELIKSGSNDQDTMAIIKSVDEHIDLREWINRERKNREWNNHYISSAAC